MNWFYTRVYFVGRHAETCTYVCIFIRLHACDDGDDEGHLVATASRHATPTSAIPFNWPCPHIKHTHAYPLYLSNWLGCYWRDRSYNCIECQGIVIVAARQSTLIQMNKWPFRPALNSCPGLVYFCLPTSDIIASFHCQLSSQEGTAPLAFIKINNIIV